MAVPARPTSGVPIETAWGQAAHDYAVANDFQMGAVNVPGVAAATSQISVTFDRPFAPGSTVRAIAGTINTASGVWIVQVATVTPTVITLVLFARDGRNVSTVTATWLAWGPRA